MLMSSALDVMDMTFFLFHVSFVVELFIQKQRKDQWQMSTLKNVTPTPKDLSF